MKVIYNRFLPFKGFAAVNIFGIVFARREYKYLSPATLNHEAIHTAQMRELYYIGFYVLYLLEWLFGLLTIRRDAYHRISFEREAYEHQLDTDYLKRRPAFAQWQTRQQ